jgi:UDP-N-acetylmuramoyl-tripeptide--D-alanyl-D-alanine ligase
MLIALSLSIVSAGTIVFFSRRLLCYLRHFQEVGYCKTNFKDWLLENGVYDKKGSVIAAIAALAIELTKEKIILSLIISTIATAGLVWLSVWEDDPRETGSPKLQTTKQSTTIYNIALGLYSILVVSTILTVYLLGADEDIACYWLVTIIAIQSSPIWLVLSSSLYKRI